MLRSLRFTNFKTWPKADVKLRRVTGFFGPNSSGKTSLLQFILLLKQTKEGTDRAVALDLNGRYVNLGVYQSMVTGHDDNKKIDWELSFRRANNLSLIDPSSKRTRYLAQSHRVCINGEIAAKSGAPFATRLTYRVGDAATFVWHCHLAMSLDGKIARSDGSFDWLLPYSPQEFGIDAYHAAIDAVVMGRDTYEIERAMPAWPHAKPVFVVTSRPIESAPALVEARSGDLRAIADELSARGYHKIGVEGGGQLIRGLIAIGRLDVLEMAIIPLVLGDGIPLFPAGTPELPLELVECEPKSGGALHVVYRRRSS